MFFATYNLHSIVIELFISSRALFSFIIFIIFHIKLRDCLFNIFLTKLEISQEIAFLFIHLYHLENSTIVSMSDLNLNLIFQKFLYSSIVILQYVISSYFIYLLIIYYLAGDSLIL